MQFHDPGYLGAECRPLPCPNVKQCPAASWNLLRSDTPRAIRLSALRASVRSPAGFRTAARKDRLRAVAHTRRCRRGAAGLLPG
jgi:hypothetical protein